MTERKNQGEGDRESARRYNEAAEKFVNSAKGREERRKADHSGDKSKTELDAAVREAEAHAKEHDPESKRDFSKPA